MDKNTISVYPNPTNTIVNINYNLENSSNVVLRVTNIQGQVITEIKTEKSSGLNTDTLDLSSQSSGMYFLTLTSGNNTFTTKVVKQ
jgi:hypothetical protein